MVDGEGTMLRGGFQTGTQHVYRLLSWRYTSPLVTDNISDIDNGNDNAAAATVRAARRNVNWIDRAVWPANYVHVEDERLLFNAVEEVAGA